jgi:hypothetical protein
MGIWRTDTQTPFRLGHAGLNTTTTNKYVALDVEAKRQALARAKPLLKCARKAGRWRQDQNLIAWLETL